MKKHMPYVLIFCLAFIGFYHNAAAQANSIKLQDTVNVNLKGGKISKELIQLRDSINVTLDSLRLNQMNTKKNTKANTKANTTGSIHELELYKDQLNKNIDEVFTQTSTNGWSNDLIQRVSGSAADVRRGYRQIVKDINTPSLIHQQKSKH